MGASQGLGPATATIDLNAVRANFAEAERLAAGRQVIAVVKADAYGHGAVPVARALAAAGCSALAVGTVGEAVALRDAGIDTSLLVLSGARGEEEADEIIARELTCVLHDADGAELIASAARRLGNRPASVHIEIDTGMSRMGARPEAAVDLVALVAADRGLALGGVMTHFARADEADLAPTRAQLQAFGALLDTLRRRGVAVGRVHAANSAGLLAIGELDADRHTDAVRPGLMLYGAQPSGSAGLRRAALCPVMSLRAPVVALRRVRRGDPVGYGALYHAPADTRIATLGLGYADGVPISTSGRGSVWLAGARRAIAGRVSMDYVAVEVGDAAVRVGDVAVIFGAERPGVSAVLPVEEAAEAAGTLSYEMMVRVGARVRREFHGEPV